MKSILITNILLFLFTFNGFSQEQKVTVKKDLVSINDTPVFKLVSTSYPDAYTLYNLNNEKLAVFNAQFYSDSKQITPGNPQGRIGYFDITFLNEEMDKCEIRIVGAKKQLAQLIISEELVKEGKLNEPAVKQFCRINGMKFSEDRQRSGATIIINR
ncbi:MAG: hypothetical protein PHI32_11735 [Dysgonamonadaceae bacterium]|nr:hypothetical protein [Dysgonamonadaceae bacterium]